MGKAIIENMKSQVWAKAKQKVTTDYILCCILEELRDLNETLKKNHSK